MSFSYTNAQVGSTSIAKIYFNNKPIRLVLKNAEIKKPIYQANSKWYISVSILDNFSNFIGELTEYTSKILNKDIKMYNDLLVKIPFRYKKFEIPFYSRNDRLIIYSDFKTNEIIDIDIELIGFDKCFLWKAYSIKNKTS
tara:strand:+ start:6974 stop:7393 length:420 start_codon:yes stop_codon:yes gene_type:complete